MQTSNSTQYGLTSYLVKVCSLICIFIVLNSSACHHDRATVAKNSEGNASAGVTNVNVKTTNGVGGENYVVSTKEVSDSDKKVTIVKTEVTEEEKILLYIQILKLLPDGQVVLTEDDSDGKPIQQHGLKTITDTVETRDPVFLTLEGEAEIGDSVMLVTYTIKETFSDGRVQTSVSNHYGIRKFVPPSSE